MYFCSKRNALKRSMPHQQGYQTGVLVSSAAEWKLMRFKCKFKPWAKLLISTLLF
jgi:hypothetical protein